MYKNYKVIDAHCHIYPEKIASKAVGGTDNFYDIVSKCEGTIDDLLARGAKAGVDHFIVQSVATTPKQVASINRFIAEEVEKSGGKFTGLGTLHPDSEDQEGDVAHLIELGLHGVKLHPDIQQFKIDDYRCLKIYELCEKHKLPILMHTGDYRYDFSNPNRLVPILQIYTDLVIVGAHFGGWSIWDEASHKLCNFKNFYVDCSSSFPYLKKETAKKIIERYTPDRVLFGTDYPMWSPKAELDTFLCLNLSEEDNKKILSGNAEKVYNF
jgi:predicted TIM-barrel fold metal-dependent hydrolase